MEEGEREKMSREGVGRDRTGEHWVRFINANAASANVVLFMMKSLLPAPSLLSLAVGVLLSLLYEISSILSRIFRYPIFFIIIIPGRQTNRPTRL